MGEGSGIILDSELGTAEARIGAYLELAVRRPEEFANAGELDVVLDARRMLDYERATGERLGVIHASPYRIFVVDLVERDGELFAYERLLAASEGTSVVVVPRLGDRFVLLRQYRHAIRGWQLAFPRGFGETGVSAADNARKELREELGAEALELEFLGEICPESGTIGVRAAAFSARIDSVDVTVGYEEIGGYLAVTAPELREMARGGELDDALTLAAFALLDS